MIRAVALLALGTAAVASTAYGADAPDVVRVSKPAFPPPLNRTPSAAGPQLALVSTAPRAPTLTRRPVVELPPDARESLWGQPHTTAFAQPGTTLVVYGTGVISAFGPTGRMKYAFDLRSFGFPPRSIDPSPYGPQEVVWARQVGGLLVVQTSHLGYASDSANRNGYLTGIDIRTGRVGWRSRSLVANAHDFVVVNGMIVSGYGFTAETDWLYLLDAKTGRIHDRLPMPSMAERISRSGDRIVVRCYDARVVVRLTQPA